MCECVWMCVLVAAWCNFSQKAWPPYMIKTSLGREKRNWKIQKCIKDVMRLARGYCQYFFLPLYHFSFPSIASQDAEAETWKKKCNYIRIKIIFFSFHGCVCVHLNMLYASPHIFYWKPEVINKKWASPITTPKRNHLLLEYVGSERLPFTFISPHHRRGPSRLGEQLHQSPMIQPQRPCLAQFIMALYT